MVSSKRVSFRKWRNKNSERANLDKRFTVKPPSRDPGTPDCFLNHLFRRTHELQLVPLYQYLTPWEAHHLVHELRRTYRRTNVFRSEKVNKIKARIARGEYHVPARELVKKWLD